MIPQSAIEESDKCEYKNGKLYIDGQLAYAGMVVEAFNESEDHQGVGKGKWAQARIIEFDEETVMVAFNTHRFIFGIKIAAIRLIRPDVTFSQPQQPQDNSGAPLHFQQAPYGPMAPAMPGFAAPAATLNSFDPTNMRLAAIEGRLAMIEQQLMHLMRNM
jgi:hypothetical protein